MAGSSTGPAPISLPRLRHPDPILQAWADQLVRALQTELQRLATPAGATGYTFTNFAGSARGADPAGASRALDPTTATTSQVAAVLATLILDMKTKGTVL